MKIGDKVAYSVQFLESIGACHTEIARWRGTVIGAQKLGDRTLVKVRWDPDNVMNITEQNLAIVGPNTKFCKC